MMNEQVMERLRNQLGAEPPQGARERVWAKLQAKRSRAVPVRWMLLAAGAVAAAALAAWRTAPPGPGQATVIQSFGSVAMVKGERRISSVPDALVGEDAWVETADGQVLVGVAHDYLLWAVENTRFRIERDGRDVVVRLDRGQVHLWSARRVHSKLWVVTPHHRGSVIGTVFSVEYARDGERYAVARGTVDVFDDDMRVAHLSGGEAWASGLEPVGVSSEVVSLLERAAAGEAVQLGPRVPAAVPAATRLPSPAGVATPPAPESANVPARRAISARRAVATASTTASVPVPGAAEKPAESETDRLAREAESLERAGQFPAAAQRYETLSHGAGIDAEWALYRLGNLREHHLGDRQGALAAWGEHRRRFPAGSLRQEVDLSIVEALVRLGRNQQALAEVERFLAQYPTSERREELARIKERLQP